MSPLDEFPDVAGFTHVHSSLQRIAVAAVVVIVDDDVVVADDDDVVVADDADVVAAAVIVVATLLLNLCWYDRRCQCCSHYSMC